MPNPIETLLTSLGIPAEDATKITTLSEEDQKTFDAKPYAEKVRTNYQTQFQNDPAFFEGTTLEKLPPEITKKIEAAQFARASGIMKGKIMKGLGLTESDLGELTDEQKEKLEPYLSLVIDKYTKTKVGDKEVQAQLIEARKQLEKFGPDYETGIKTKYEGEANQKITAAIFNANLIGELATIPGLKIKPSTLAREANEILNSKYAFERVGDFSVELRQKANPQMKVLRENSSKELTLKEALLDIATNEGWIEKEKEGNSGSGVTAAVKPNNGKLTMVPPHLQDKISQKIAEEAKS